MADAPIIPLALIGIGGYLSWFAVRYWATDVEWPTDPVKAVLTGQPIPQGKKEALVGLVTPSATAGAQAVIDLINQQNAAGGTGDDFGAKVAAKALTYQGTGYVFGGNASVPGQWDCSSFVSKVLSGDFGLQLPGGGHWGDAGYPPHAHGPGSTAFMLYGTGVNPLQVRAGDLVVSVEHIGIAISGTQMISAQQPSTGTRVSGFPAGFPAGPPVYRRPPYPVFAGPPAAR